MRTLSAEQETAALLEAQGMKPSQIAAAIDRSARQVYTYRQDKNYQQRVAELTKAQLDNVEAVVMRVRNKVIRGAEDVIDSLVEMAQTALTPAGEVDYDTRLEAAEKLLKYADRMGLSVPPPAREVGGGGGAAVASSAVVVFRDERSNPGGMGEVIEATVSNGT